ncbi:MAG: holo-ACP synthase [Actinobacteria bacterium]|jgi:holo-[acyl-carrier protein] synthase|nr:holo-ACP synthase [Actinomycetota bacterium]
MQVIGVGVDVVDTARFRELLSRRPRIKERLFSPTERQWAERARDPAMRFAVRFAAKEAVMKALGVGIGAFALNEVEVVRLATGQPRVELKGKAAQLAKERGVERWDISLSHTELVSVAMVVAQGIVSSEDRSSGRDLQEGVDGR